MSRGDVVKYHENNNKGVLPIILYPPSKFANIPGEGLQECLLLENTFESSNIQGTLLSHPHSTSPF